jgi:hypothetical protein
MHPAWTGNLPATTRTTRKTSGPWHILRVPVFASYDAGRTEAWDSASGIEIIFWLPNR